MANSVLPFGLLPPGLLPGWSLPGSGGLLVYRGLGAPAGIDWTRPLGAADMGQSSATLRGLGHARGIVHCYGLRAVSEAGVQERNTHVVAYVVVDHEGRLLPPPLPSPRDVAAVVLPDGRVEIGFCCVVRPGCQAPTAYEVLGDGGAGRLDLDTPLAVVAAEAGRGVYQAIVASALPARFAVRARSGQQVGPLSAVVAVGGPPRPRAVELL